MLRDLRVFTMPNELPSQTDPDNDVLIALVTNQ